jgi:hypothetical protein
LGGQGLLVATATARAYPGPYYGIHPPSPTFLSR